MGERTERGAEPNRRLFFRGLTAGGIGLLAAALPNAALADDKEGKEGKEDKEHDGERKAALVLHPRGAGLDDWPRLLQVARDNAYARPIVLAEGRWLCRSTGALPSGTTLIGSSGVEIVMSLASTGRQRNTAFWTEPTFAGVIGQVAADVVVGGTSVELTMPTMPTVGQLIQLANPTGLSAGIYTVVAVGGAVVVVDRPIEFPFAKGHVAAIVTTQPRDIRIFGGGMRITGTGDRAIEIIGAYSCEVNDVHYDTKGGCVSDSAMSYDIGCRDCSFVRCSADMSGGPAVAHGILLESTERSRIVDCRTSNCLGFGLYMVDSIGAQIVDSHAVSCGTGIWIGTDDALGNFDCEVVRCSSTRNAHGLGGNRQARTKIIGLTACDNTGAGLSFGGDGVVDVTVFSCKSLRNAYGMLVAPGAKRTVVRGLDVSGSSKNCVIASDDVDIEGLRATGLVNTQSAVVLVGAVSRLSSFVIESAGIVNGVSCNGGVASISAGTVRMSATKSIGVDVVTGSVALQNVVLRGASATGVTVRSKATLRTGSGVDTTECARPISMAAESYQNIGSIDANGSTGVVVKWPDLKTNDVVVLEPTDTLVQTAPHPTVLATPGLGFTVSASADDFNRYRFRVVSF